MGSNKDSPIQITETVGNFIKLDQTSCQTGRNVSKSNDDEDEYGTDTHDMVNLNVGGMRHETQISTLEKWPNTRLHAVAATAKATGRRDFYFDRNPQIFVHILNYYRIGKLHMPSDICGPMIKAEIDYWGLDEKEIEQCCWVNYISYEDTTDMLKKFEADEENRYNSVHTDDRNPFWTRTRPKLWKALQDPYSSKKALIYAIVSVLVLLLSIIVFVLETIPSFRTLTDHIGGSTEDFTTQELRSELDIFTDISPGDILLMIDNVCNLFFFIELVVTFLASPNRLKFLRSPVTCVEILALLPYYIGVIIIMLHPNPKDIFNFIRVLFVTRVFRIFRVFVLMKHFLALKILFYTIIGSTKELLLLLMVFLIGVIIFACIEYYMELLSGIETDIQDIPTACWWAIITMTTVGYGDIVPKSVLGHVVGAFCAVSGVLVISLSVPVIVNNFTIYYVHAQSWDKLRKKKKKSEQELNSSYLKQEITENVTKKGFRGKLLGWKKTNSVGALVAGKLDTIQDNNGFDSAIKVHPVRRNQDGANGTQDENTGETESDNGNFGSQKQMTHNSMGNKVSDRIPVRHKGKM